MRDFKREEWLNTALSDTPYELFWDHSQRSYYIREKPGKPELMVPYRCLSLDSAASWIERYLKGTADSEQLKVQEDDVVVDGKVVCKSKLWQGEAAPQTVQRDKAAELRALYGGSDYPNFIPKASMTERFRSAPERSALDRTFREIQRIAHSHDVQITFPTHDHFDIAGKPEDAVEAAKALSTSLFASLSQLELRIAKMAQETAGMKFEMDPALFCWPRMQPNWDRSHRIAGAALNTPCFGEPKFGFGCPWCEELLDRYPEDRGEGGIE